MLLHSLAPLQPDLPTTAKFVSEFDRPFHRCNITSKECKVKGVLFWLSIHKVVPDHVADDHVGIFDAAHVG